MAIKNTRKENHMGYRSSIAIAINGKHAKKFTEFVYSIGEPDSTNAIKGGLITGAYFESIKWYDFDNSDIKDLTSWLKSLDDSDYGFIEIGEDFNDVTYNGSPFDFEMFVIRKLKVPF